MSRWLMRAYLDTVNRLGCCGCGCGIGIAFIGFTGTLGGYIGWRVVT